MTVATVCPRCLCGWYDDSKPVGAVCGDTKYGSSEPCEAKLIAAKQRKKGERPRRRGWAA